MNNNEYQTHVEPSNKEVWYSSSIASVESNMTPTHRLDRYINKLNLVSYSNIRAIEFIKQSQLYLPVSSEDNYYFVDASKRYRPDLISQEIYGTPVLYWVILSCNNLRTPMEVRTGLTLRIPPLSSIINGGKLL